MGLKSALSEYKESSRTLITVLLASGVGVLVDVIVPDNLLQEEVVALPSGLAPEEDNGLHVAEHEGLDLGIIKDGGLVLDVGVGAFDQHGDW